MFRIWIRSGLSLLDPGPGPVVIEVSKCTLSELIVIFDYSIFFYIFSFIRYFLRYIYIILKSKKSQRSYKTVEIKVFFIIFA